jgi:signal transduction histidine kinase
MRGMAALISSVWNAPAASPRPPRRVWRDWALVGLLVSVAVVEGLIRTDLAFPVVSVLATVVIIPTLLWRRTRPLLMLGIAFAVSTVFQLVLGSGEQLYTIAFVLLLAYAVVRWGTGRGAVIGIAILIASVVPTFDPSKPGDAVGGLAVVLGATSIALAIRTRAALRERELDRARSQERADLARDLHDTVAHHVSAIAIQAQAGLATARERPEAAAIALGVIEAEASRTLAEMRTMVRVLRRDGEPELAPVARIADVEALASSRPGEPTVRVSVDGSVGDVPGPLAAAIYRIAQESITNARRHARRATQIDVSVRAEKGGVRLEVHDDGEPGADGEPGFGITGMIERAALLGGSCAAGRAPTGGWTVTAVLPRSGSAR